MVLVTEFSEKLPLTPRGHTLSELLLLMSSGCEKLLRLAESVRVSNGDLLGSAIFVYEYMAIRRASLPMRLADEAFALDLLIAAFLLTDALGAGGHWELRRNLERWHLERPAGITGVGSTYEAYASLPENSLQQYVDEARSLLHAACLLAARDLASEAHAYDLREESAEASPGGCQESPPVSLLERFALSVSSSTISFPAPGDPIADLPGVNPALLRRPRAAPAAARGPPWRAAGALARSGRPGRAPALLRVAPDLQAGVLPACG